MRLGELGTNRPTQAGKAILKYTSDGNSPRRERNVIVLPDNPLSELLPLRDDWSQFLWRNECYRDRWEQDTHFAGTDENPFLVQMDQMVFDLAVMEGPLAFYTSLVPAIILRVQQRAPNCQTSLRRQGDIFCLSLSYSDQTIIEAGKLIFGDAGSLGGNYVLRTTLDPKTKKNLMIFNTRHELIGEGFQNIKLLGEDVGLMVRGTIRAPDHSPLVLERLSVLGQTQHLRSPREAD